MPFCCTLPCIYLSRLSVHIPGEKTFLFLFSSSILIFPHQSIDFMTQKHRQVQWGSLITAIFATLACPWPRTSPMLDAVKRAALPPHSSIETPEHHGQKCWSIHRSHEITLLSTSGEKQPIHWQGYCQLNGKQTCLTQVWSTAKENCNLYNPNSPIGCPHWGTSAKLECFTLNVSFLGSHGGLPQTCPCEAIMQHPL